MKGCDGRVSTAAAILFFLVSPHARADLLFDTLFNGQTGSSDSPAFVVHNYPPATGFAGDDLRAAIPIVVPGGLEYAIDTIVLNVAARQRADQRLTVALAGATSAGLPGATIESFTITNLPVRADGSGPLTYPLTAVALPDHPVLSPGKYWVTLSTPDANNFSDIYWFDRADRQTEFAYQSSPLNGPGWLPGGTIDAPQARVTATRTPEPVAALLGFGSLLLLARRRAH
jgi:hypothetical protein